MENGKHNMDKLQILSEMLADTICMAFAEISTITLLNNVHACHSLTRDLAVHLRRSHCPDFNLQSDVNLRDDVELAKIFGRQKVDGRQGDLVMLANFIKHADKDPFSLIETVSTPLVQAYLFIAVKDFIQLRKALLRHGLAKLDSKGLVPLTEKTSFFKNLAGCFKKQSVPETDVKLTRVDMLCGFFLQVMNLITKSQEKAKKVRQPLRREEVPIELPANMVSAIDKEISRIASSLSSSFEFDSFVEQTEDFEGVVRRHIGFEIAGSKVTNYINGLGIGLNPIFKGRSYYFGSSEDAVPIDEGRSLELMSNMLGVSEDEARKLRFRPILKPKDFSWLSDLVR